MRRNLRKGSSRRKEKGTPQKRGRGCYRAKSCPPPPYTGCSTMGSYIGYAVGGYTHVIAEVTREEGGGGGGCGGGEGRGQYESGQG
jgi:hypothetical protein